MGKGKGSPAQIVGVTVTVTMRMGRQGGEDVRERKRGGKYLENAYIGRCIIERGQRGRDSTYSHKDH